MRTVSKYASAHCGACLRVKEEAVAEIEEILELIFGKM